MSWSMRMIGVTVFALAGNMWVNSHNTDGVSVRQVGWVMCVSATSLGILTLAVPTHVTFFVASYAAVGFVFGLLYLFNLLKS